jgi:tRNA pseudouridine55 synthase
MDGVLLIDKPAGLTSHDVVARLRRILGERRLGHTGTLDPIATGLLVIVAGKATRLSSLLTGHDKTYDAVIRLGQATSTDDVEGEPIGEPAAPPDATALPAALERFRGTFAQTPPAHSAKKIGGQRAYRLARARQPVLPVPVEVTVKELTVLGYEGGDLRVRVAATAGFYVRALARDLGAELGCGGHLRELRRLACGPFRVEDALPLDQIEAQGGIPADRVIAPVDALPELDLVEVTPAGLQRIRNGNYIGPVHVAGTPGGGTPLVRIVAEGRLVALARRRDAALHPVTVLG